MSFTIPLNIRDDKLQVDFCKPEEMQTLIKALIRSFQRPIAISQKVKGRHVFNAYALMIFSLNSSSQDGLGTMSSVICSHISGLLRKVSRIVSVSGLKLLISEILATSTSSYQA